MTTPAVPATTMTTPSPTEDPRYQGIEYQDPEYKGRSAVDGNQESDASKEDAANTEAPPAASPPSEAPKAETTKSSYTVSTEVGFITHRLGGNVDQKSLKGVSAAVLIGGESPLATTKQGRSVYYQAGVSFSQASSPISGQTALARQDATSEEGASRGQTEGVDAFGNPLIEEDTDGNVANNNGTANVNNLDVTTNHITTLGAVAEVGTRWQLAKATVHAGVGLNVFGASGAAVLNRFAAGVHKPTYGYSFYGTGGISRFFKGKKASFNFGVAGKLGLQALNYTIPGDASGGSANMGVIGGVAATFGVTTHRTGNKPVNKSERADNQPTAGGVKPVGRLTQDDIKAFTTPAGEGGAGLNPEQITTTGELISLEGDKTFESMTITFNKAPIPKDVNGKPIEKITFKYDASKLGWVALVYSEGQLLPPDGVHFPNDIDQNGKFDDVFPQFYTGPLSGQVSFLTAIKRLMASPPPPPTGLKEGDLAFLKDLTTTTPKVGDKTITLDLGGKNLKASDGTVLGTVKLVYQEGRDGKDGTWILRDVDGTDITLPEGFALGSKNNEFDSPKEVLIWILTGQREGVEVIYSPSGKTTINLSQRVPFTKGKDTLTSSGEEILSNIAALIVSLHEAGTIDSYTLYIGALASRDKYYQQNFELAQKRGTKLKEELESINPQLAAMIKIEIEPYQRLPDGVFESDAQATYYAPEGSEPYAMFTLQLGDAPRPKPSYTAKPADTPKPSSRGTGGGSGGGKGAGGGGTTGQGATGGAAAAPAVYGAPSDKAAPAAPAGEKKTL